MIFSGGYAYMITRKKNYYPSLLAKGPSSFSDEIEKVRENDNSFPKKIGSYKNLPRTSLL